MPMRQAVVPLRPRQQPIQRGTPPWRPTARCPLPAPPARLRDLERQAIERTLAALDGNVAATARQLGISRNTIYRRRNGGSD